MFAEFAQYWQSGALLLQGKYNGLYSLPLTAVFALLSLLPYQVAAGFFGGCLVVAWWLFKKKKIGAVPWLFFAPVTLSLVQGRLDILWLWLFTKGTPLTIAISSLVPELLPFSVPAIWKNRLRWKEIGAWLIAIYSIPTAIRPVWWLEWFQHGRFFSLSTSTWSIEPHLGTVIMMSVFLLFVASSWGRCDWIAVVNILLPVNGLVFLAGYEKANWRLIIWSWAVVCVSLFFGPGILCFIPLWAFLQNPPQFNVPKRT